MARAKNLDTLVKNERVRVQMNIGHIVLRPKDRVVVQLRNGQYDQMDQEAIEIYAEGEHNMGSYSRLYDMDDAADRETIELLREKIDREPEWANHVFHQVKIVGEYSAGEPWPGYDDQSAEQVETYYRSMPDRLKKNHALEGIMKHELTRVDEDGNSLTDKAKVDLLNKLFREVESAEKDAAEDKVAL